MASSSPETPRRRARSASSRGRKWLSDKASFVWGHASSLISKTLNSNSKRAADESKAKKRSQRAASKSSSPSQEQRRRRRRYSGQFKERTPTSAFSPPTPRLRRTQCTRTLWLMELLLESMKEDGATESRITSALTIDRQFWLQRGVKIIGFSAKMNACNSVCNEMEGLRNTIEFSPEDTTVVSNNLQTLCDNLTEIQNTLSSAVSCVIEARPKTPPATPISVLSDTDDDADDDDDELSFASIVGNVKTFGLNFAKNAKRFAHKSLPHRLQSHENVVYTDTCCRVLMYHVLLTDLLHIYSTKPQIIKSIEKIIEFMRVCVCAFILDDAQQFFHQYQRNAIPSLLRLYHAD